MRYLVDVCNNDTYLKVASIEFAVVDTWSECEPVAYFLDRKTADFFTATLNMFEYSS